MLAFGLCTSNCKALGLQGNLPRRVETDPHQRAAEMAGGRYPQDLGGRLMWAARWIWQRVVRPLVIAVLMALGVAC